MSKTSYVQHETNGHFPVIDPKQYDGIIYPSDIADAKKKIEEQYFVPYKLLTPGYVLKPLVEAITAEGPRKVELLEKARQKAEVHYLAQWSRGNIKVKDSEAPPMPEEIKIELKELKMTRKIEKENEKQLIRKMKKKKVVKTAVYEDKFVQSAYLEKYKWLVPHTFTQSPHKPGGTVVDIKCQKCGKRRTINLCDSFQIKLCLPCKGK